ncbi:MAG TPA: putative O-glycosylation ligase, exosortase A system-associated [Thermoanaerobaculia bacterium]|nr:putative O-glycosylation ligase, exosortase A system-associated [Thermoanaerobaculia bacterium]
MRDLLVLAIVYGSLPVILLRPYFGLLVYCWLAYMRPQDMGWGDARAVPLSQWVAIAMVVGILLTLGRERVLTLKAQTILLALLAGWISISYVNALLPDIAEYVYGHYWKAMLIAVLTTGLVRDRKRFRILMMVIAFSIGLLGAKRGLYGLMRGGIRYHDGPGGFMSDNNAFALHLNMVLPLLVGIAVVEKERILKAAAWAMAGLSVLTILFTFSRGGLLTLCLIAPLLIWRSRQRLLVGGVLAVGLAGFLLFTSDSFTQQYADRASSISDYEEDGSAQGRLHAWQTSWRVFLDYPLTGVGPNNLQVVHSQYSPEPGRFRVSHNVLLQFLSECGWPALLLFLTTLGVTLWKLQTLRAEKTTAVWMETYARMIQISILAYLAGSMFLNTAYSELIYELVAAATALEVIAQTASVTEEEEPAVVAAAAPEAPWWKRPRPLPTPSSATWMKGA